MQNFNIVSVLCERWYFSHNLCLGTVGHWHSCTGNGGITVPGGVLEPWGRGTEGHGDGRLGLGLEVSEISSNLNCSVILWLITLESTRELSAILYCKENLPFCLVCDTPLIISLYNKHPQFFKPLSNPGTACAGAPAAAQPGLHHSTAAAIADSNLFLNKSTKHNPPTD